ncbi:MAG: hypothetical protein HIU91_05405 [Acidobacteria bacterium]|nr:hypothetical protein [Acidobacteriota bacterium]
MFEVRSHDALTGRRFFVTILLFCCSAISVCFGQTTSTPNLQTLSDSHQWFALRDATEHKKAPLIYRAITEYAFNQVRPAQKHLNAVIKTAPHSDNAYDAHGMLANLDFRNGLYREAYLQLEAMLSEKPNAADVKNMISMFRALSQSDQSVVAKKASTLPMAMNENGMFIPLVLDGREARYLLDTGFNLSAMSESEAKRLGLQVQSVETQFGSITAASLSVRVAFAKDVFVGGLHLRNVAFDVIPDAQEPFVDLPSGDRGILGIPVLLDMQTFRWNPNGTFAFGFKPKHKNLSASNLAFDALTPVTQVAVEKKELEFSLDTGATRSILYAPFAKEFPGLVSASGQKESHTLTGVAGTSTYNSVVLPSVDLELGGLDVHLTPAHILTQDINANWAPGNLGRDLLNQAHTITFDFNAMTLRLQ